MSLLSLLIAFILGAALARLFRPAPPPELPPSSLICPRCERELHDHAPDCRHSPTRRRP